MEEEGDAEFKRRFSPKGKECELISIYNNYAGIHVHLTCSPQSTCIYNTTMVVLVHIHKKQFVLGSSSEIVPVCKVHRYQEKTIILHIIPTYNIHHTFMI